MASSADLSAYENYPLNPAPSGQISNFKNPESRGPAIIILCSVFIGIMWPIFILRLYSKVWVIRQFWLDDASAIIAALGATAFAAGVIWSINDKVFGPHEWDVRAVLLTPHTIKITFILSPLYSLTMFFAKIALFLLYHRLFALNRWTKIAIYCGISVTSCFYLATFIVQLVLCIPRRHENWASMTCLERCSRGERLGDVHGVFGLVSDLYIFILPLPVLYRLQMSLKKKIGVTAAFLTGLIAVIASSIGLYYRVPESNGTDVTWNETPAAGLAVVEATVGVICGSVPYLPAYFRRHSAKFSPVTHILQGIRSGYKSRFKRKYVKQPVGVGNLGPKETTPRNLQVKTEVLGSIQGEGTFLDIERTSRILGQRSAVQHPRSETNSNNTGSIISQYHEMTEASQQENQLQNVPGGTITGESSHLPAHNREDSVEATETTATKTSSRRGYWEIMSLFRSTNKDSTSRSGTYLRS